MSNCLFAAIRSGSRTQVRKGLDAGACVHTSDGAGMPGMPLALAAHLGNARIVRELIGRGADPNPGATAPPSRSPIAIAVRARHREVVRTLIELGATIPEGCDTGLCPEEIEIAQHVSMLLGRAQRSPSGGRVVVESIECSAVYGVDTNALIGEARDRLLAQ